MAIEAFDPSKVNYVAPPKYPTGAEFSAPVSGIPAVLEKWDKYGGFGFVRLDDGRKAFLHKSVLRLAVAYRDGGILAWDYDYLVEVEESARGLRVSKIVKTMPHEEIAS